MKHTIVIRFETEKTIEIDIPEEMDREESVNAAIKREKLLMEQSGHVIWDIDHYDY